MVKAPVTPPKAENAPQSTSVKSTPLNQGSASRAENRVDPRVEAVKGEILHDLQTTQNLGIRDVILGLIRLLTNCEIEKAGEILEACLEAVIPICNGDEKSFGRFPRKIKEEKKKAAKDLRESLEAYCPKPQKEHQRYPFFVRALNAILRAFRGRNADVGLPEDLPEWDSELDILFHVNDPQVLKGSHGGDSDDSIRKPDIVSIALALANMFHDSRSKWNVAANEAESSEPVRSEEPKWWGWKEILQSWELKALRTIDLSGNQLKRNFGTDLPTGEVLPIPIPKEDEKDDNIEEDLTNKPPEAERSAGPSSNKTSAQGPDIAPRRQSERIKKASESAPASGSGAESSGKRKASVTGPSQGPSKKVKETASGARPDVTVQSAMYGAERLCSHISVAHVTGMIVVDDLAYFCWYDRQGCIQSTGVNFIQHLPYFAVLVVLFGRFKKSHWGINTSLEDEEDISIEDASLRVGESLYHRFSFVGRGTKTVEVELTTTPELSPEDIADEKLIAKLSFPEESRANEKDIIEAAHNFATGPRKYEIVDHIPHVFRSEDYTEHSTSRIRELFGLSTEGSRAMRILLLRRYYPIVNLPPDDFWRAYWQIVQCHYLLWGIGIAHGDISVNNIMYDKREGIPMRGILNDFDLATIMTDQAAPNLDRTGTTPFMALELLTNDGMMGRLVRLYRHDLESFTWVLYWIVVTYKEAGVKFKHLPLELWLNSNMTICQSAKTNVAYSAGTGHLRGLAYTAYLLVGFWARRFQSWRDSKALAIETGEEFAPTEPERRDIIKNVLDVVVPKLPLPQGLETLQELFIHL